MSTTACHDATLRSDLLSSAGGEQNPSIQPAEVTITVYESALTGDLVPYNGSVIEFTLNQYSTWEGKTYSGYGVAYTSVYLDATSSWTLTGDSTVANFTDATMNLTNIHSNGHNLYYNRSYAANAWLKGRTMRMNGGGMAKPL